MLDVLGCHGEPRRDGLDSALLLALTVSQQQVDDELGPVLPVTQQSQIRERLLG